MAEPFYTDGMTVSQILALGDDVLSKLDRRELSRALRTVALAANKRIDRLTQYAYRRHGKYVEKLDGPGLDLNLLNHYGKTRFGVGDKNRNEIYQEFARVRSFMSSKGSTVRGSINIRRAKEKALFGKTREEMGKGLNKKEKRALAKKLNKAMETTYKTYKEFEEEEAWTGMYEKEKARSRLRSIGSKMLEGKSPEEAKEELKQEAQESYEANEEQYQNDDFGELFGNQESEWWEDI